MIVFPGCPSRWLIALIRRNLPDLASRPGLFEIGVARFMVPTGIAEQRAACFLTSLGWNIGPRSDGKLFGLSHRFCGGRSFLLRISLPELATLSAVD